MVAKLNQSLDAMVAETTTKASLISARLDEAFAKGALAAALWVADKPPGLYDMQDVLGFNPAGA